jgi:hypothetical protein
MVNLVTKRSVGSGSKIPPTASVTLLTEGRCIAARFLPGSPRPAGIGTPSSNVFETLLAIRAP